LDVALQSMSTTDRAAAGWLSRVFFALAGLTYVLIVLGALVRAHGAGLACPDWPLCLGEFVPAFDFKIAFEWGHRALAGSIGIAFSILALVTLRHAELRGAMWKALLVAAVLLATQIVLGGLTVLELLAYWTVTSHLVTGNAFALALVLIARRLARLSGEASGRLHAGHDPARKVVADPAQRLATTLAAALLGIQIVLGGLVASNYAGLACPDWPTCMNGEYFPSWTGIQGLHVWHRVCGYSVVLAIGLAAWLDRSHLGSRRWLAIAAGLAFAQVMVGIANVWLRVPVEMTGLHSALAAALICTVGVGVREVWRRDPREAKPNGRNRRPIGGNATSARRHSAGTARTQETR
jgi:cytochrome c oxidase assembly protein subunit 15